MESHERIGKIAFLRAIDNYYGVTSVRNTFVGMTEITDTERCCFDAYPAYANERVTSFFDCLNLDHFQEICPTIDELNVYKEYIKNNYCESRDKIDALNMIEEAISKKTNVLTLSKTEETEKIEKTSYSIKEKDFDPVIIEEMKGKVDKGKILQLLSIAGSDSNCKKFADKSVANEYLDKWAKSKYEFYLMFGKNLSIQKEIEIEMNEQEMGGFERGLTLQFPIHASTIERFTIQEFLKNEISGEDELFKEVCPKLYTVGTKVTKFLSRLLNDKEFDIEVSKVFENKIIKGNVVVSIDPYDYLTMSMNKHRWESCQSLEMGCYSTGALSYMCDETTIIAYKENGKEYSYNYLGFKYTGNSKSWRQCIYYDKNTSSMIFSREYPYENEDVGKEVRGLIEQQISDYLGKLNNWKILTNGFKGRYTKNASFCYHDIKEGYNFNTVYPTYSSNMEECEFSVGSEVFCVYCGKSLSSSLYSTTSISRCSNCSR